MGSVAGDWSPSAEALAGSAAALPAPAGAPVTAFLTSADLRAALAPLPARDDGLLEHSAPEGASVGGERRGWRRWRRWRRS
jgi:hypothetical protein